METENDLLNLLLKSPNSEKIELLPNNLKLIIIFPLAKIEMICRVFGSLGGVVLKVLF